MRMRENKQAKDGKSMSPLWLLVPAKPVNIVYCLAEKLLNKANDINRLIDTRKSEVIEELYYKFNADEDV
jgi:hypothetical protein